MGGACCVVVVWLIEFEMGTTMMANSACGCLRRSNRNCSWRVSTRENYFTPGLVRQRRRGAQPLQEHGHDEFTGLHTSQRIGTLDGPLLELLSQPSVTRYIQRLNDPSRCVSLLNNSHARPEDERYIMKERRRIRYPHRKYARMHYTTQPSKRPLLSPPHISTHNSPFAHHAKGEISLRVTDNDVKLATKDLL